MIEDKIYKEGEMSILTPSHKNIHQILALEDSIMLDVLIPDYGEEDCNYYYRVKYSNKEYLLLQTM
jgi:hypothetical protein